MKRKRHRKKSVICFEDSEARYLANLIFNELPHLHRGAEWRVEGQIVVVFGNDG